MPRITIEQLRNTEFTSSYRWTIEFVTFPAAIVTPPTATQISTRAESVEIPKQVNTLREINLTGFKVFQPGIPETGGQITLTMIEAVDAVILNFIDDWNQAIWANNTGVSNLAADLRAEIQITPLNNLDVNMYRYTLKGCYLADSEIGTLDAETADPIKPTLTINYDDFDREKLV